MQVKTDFNVNHLIDLFKSINRGEFVLDIQDGMRDCVNGTVNTQKTSKLTIEISIAMDKQTDAVRVIGKVKTKIPELDPRASLFFVSPEGNLTRIDHKQPHMFPEQGE